MEMVERGELSLIAMTKDEKGKLTDDFVKLYNENAGLTFLSSCIRGCKPN